MMTTDIHIFPFHPGLEEGVFQMKQEIAREFNTTFSPARFRELVQRPDARYWVACAGPEVVGTIGIILFSEKQALLKSMMVRAAYRGPFYGTALRLLDTLLAYAAEKSVQDLFLGTMERFRAAQRFYRKNGFSEIQAGELPPGFLRNPVDTLFFHKKL